MLRRISIGLRSALAFSIVGGLVLVLGVIAIIRLNDFHSEMNVIADHRVPALESAMGIMSEFYHFRLQNANVLGSQGQRQIEYKAQVVKAKKSLDDLLDTMASLARAQEAKDLMLALEKDIKAFSDYQQQQMNLLEKGDLEGALLLQEGQMKVVRQHVTEVVRDIVNFQRQRVDSSHTKVAEIFNQSIWIISLLMTIAVAIVVLFAWLFTRSLVTPMKRVLNLAESIASGDLSKSIRDDGKDETANMIQTLAKMQSNLRDTINQIQESSGQLASTSEELSAITEQSTRGINSQNEQLEQAVSAVTELTVAVEDVAENAVSMSKESELAEQTANSGRQQVEHTIEMANSLLTELEQTMSGVNTLAEQVNSIGTVLDVIRAIADQTNLLALNAAIEAARAGESGRGFAVVADEVRALAHRTQHSTTEIEQVIQAVQSGTKSTVSSMHSSHEKAQKSLEISKQAGDALFEITQSVSRINEQNMTIASSAEEQANVSREVDQNLTNIRDIANEVATGASQSSTATQELSKLAEALSLLTRKFRI
ncbi:methyl-accepting chemotaxis protein [Neptunicella sp. SCSIO 80796]|uniref:methyl-accepting chemotaxis protein n=1 Tax=Neptunicella plasticusilytica TaxID=3117012 RepID=UPI003A4E5F89